MTLKICTAIVSILILIYLVIKNYKKILVNIYNIFEKFILKIIEIFWIIVLGLVILLPLFSYYIMKKLYGISYNEFKELLEIILNSNYVIVIGIIIIVYLFRNQLKKKIGQLKEVNGNGFKFETQFEKNLERNLEKNKTEEKNCDTILEENEEIYDEMKNKILGNDTDIKNQKTNENIIYELEEQLRAKDRIIKKSQFINIKNHIAKTTKIILVYMYERYKISNNLFKQDELEKVLKDTVENEKIKIDLNIEMRAIIQFLLRNKIIDTEDDKNYCITEYGVEFLEFLFEGRC